MKKIILLLILQLTVLMGGVDLIISPKGTLGTHIDESPPPVSPPSVGGIIQNSSALIYQDMYGQNVGWVSNMPGYGAPGTGQLFGPVPRSIGTLRSGYDTLNAWIEIEAGQAGQSACSVTNNRATNTRVEIGYIRGYVLRGNTWTKYTESKNTYFGSGGDGAYHPHSSGNLQGFDRACGLDEQNTGLSHHSLVTSKLRKEPSGFLSVKPEYYYRWHAWAPRVKVAPVSNIDGLYVNVYLRLIVDDPTKPDDRDKANYVAHIGADRSWLVRQPNGMVYVSGTALSRYKRITSDWQPFSMTIGFTTPQQFEAANFPITLQP